MCASEIKYYCYSNVGFVYRLIKHTDGRWVGWGTLLRFGYVSCGCLVRGLIVTGVCVITSQCKSRTKEIMEGNVPYVG